MDRLIYTAMTGASAAANRQSVLANNLANVSTNGFAPNSPPTVPYRCKRRGASTRVFAWKPSGLPGSCRPAAANRPWT